jgi:hypothetical protein
MSHYKIEDDLAKRVAARMHKKKALKVYTWDDNSDGVSEMEVPDELAGDMQAISLAIDRQVAGEDIEPGEHSQVTEVIDYGSDQVGVGYYGRLTMFMVAGPTAKETAEHIYNFIDEMQDELNSMEAILLSLQPPEEGWHGQT